MRSSLQRPLLGHEGANQAPVRTERSTIHPLLRELADGSQVAVTHPNLPQPVAAKVQDGVLFKDVIATDKASRTKALLNDDSILTVGEYTRVEITEHIYDPHKSVRSVVISLIEGKLRALVGKIFTGSGSKFEVHTPTAVAAARGTYFVVFHLNGVSGVINIGTHGHVELTSGGRTVPVPPEHFSVTPSGGGPPSPPAVTTGGNVPSQVADAVQGTEVKEGPKEENPKHLALATGGTAPVLAPSSLTPPGVSDSSGESTTSSSSSASTLSATTTLTTTTTVVQVPAVTSGATNSPPPPPTGSIGEWFAKLLARLFEQFSEFIAKVNEQEQRAFAKAEEQYEKRLGQADAQEQKMIEEALRREAESVARANEEYERTLARINDDTGKGKGQGNDDLAKAQAKLEADLARAAAIREAAVKRAQEIEAAKIAKARLIQEARILRAQTLEAAKVDRSGHKFVQRVSRAREQYLAKLCDAGASQTELEKARRLV